MSWQKTPSGLRIWVDDATGLAQLRDQTGNIVQGPVSGALAKIRSGELEPATPEEIKAYDAGKKAGGPLRAAATGAVAGALDVGAGAASMFPAALEAVSKPAVRSYLKTVKGKPEAEIAAAEARAAPFAPSRIVREALGGREVMENIAAVGAEVAGEEGEVAAREWRETEQATAEAHPVASGAGYAAGQVVGTLAVPGLGGALRGAGLGARALLGAAEGAALGTAAVGEDAYLKDHELTAEQLLAGAGVGGVLGGGLVFGLHGAGRIFRRLGTRGTTAIDAAVPEATHATGQAGLREMAEAVLGEPPAKGTVGLWAALKERALSGYESAASLATGQSKQAIRETGLRNVFEKGKDSAVAKFDRRVTIREEFARDMHEAVGNLEKHSRTILDENVFESAKGSHVAKLVDTAGDALERQKAAAYSEWSRIRDVAQQMADDPATFGARKQTRGFLSALDQVGGTIAKATKGEELYTTVDALKRKLDTFAKSARTASVGNVQGWLAGPQTANVAKALEDAANGTRAILMDSAVWGEKAASAQRAINAKWQRVLGDNVTAVPGSYRDFSRNFFDASSDVIYGEGRRAYTPSEPKFSAFARGYGTFNNRGVEENLRHHVDTVTDLASTIHREYELTGAPAKSIAEVERWGARVKELLTKHGDDLKQISQAEQLQAAEGGGLGGIGAGAVGGGVLGGPIGMGLGAVFGGVSKPFSTARTVQAAMALTANVRTQLRGDVTSVVTRGAAAATGSRLPRLPVHGPAAGAAAGYSLSERRERFAKQADTVLAVKEPAELQKRIAESLGTLPEDMPTTAAMVASKSATIANYLANKLGPMIPPRSPLQPNAPVPQLGRDELARWESIWEAATNPQSVLASWKAGRMTRDQAVTLRDCWPRIFGDLQEHAASELGKIKQPLGYKQRRALDMLLDFNGAVEPTLRPGFLAQTEAWFAATQQKTQPGSRPMQAAPKTAHLHELSHEET